MPNTASPADRRELLSQLSQCMREDRSTLRNAIQRAVRTGKGMDRLAQRLAASRQRVDWRIQNRPSIDVPPDLPISVHADRLKELISEHPVLVVCGETGCGKSTQIPKMCLAAGYGIHGMIGQTQPRRLAVRSVVERLCQELSSPLGEAVGYRVRFEEQISERNYIRVLTDGMLLNECALDQRLERYDVLIIDEAHERSLNIDFLLGLSRRILAQRPDFRLIITSATLDSSKLSDYFDDAPVVPVSGRLYPVEVRYRPLTDDLDRLEVMSSGILEAIDELHCEALGDILVFLPGEREIRDAVNDLQRRLKPGIELLPLYARLTPAEQQRIFRPGQATRIILATNVAETSLTVPGIRHVIDSGLARISRYSPQRKLQRLPVEKVSQAAANQRAGRCGRVANGICIRLYDEDDFASRAAFTDPEILRTSLADVILRMKTMGIGDLDTFPLIDHPGRRRIQDGLQHLLELGALNAHRQVTDLGHRMARIPLDPRIARMLLAAEQEGCLEEMVIISAALSLPDPRQSPADQIDQARQKHQALSHHSSDFLVLLDIWAQFRRIQKAESRRQADRWCRKNFLSVFRMREWAALQARIKQSLKQLGIRPDGKAADPAHIHRALISGLLSNVARLATPAQDVTSRRKANRSLARRAEYEGTFGKSLRIFPGSVLHGRAPQWIICAELVETGRIFARTIAQVEPGWIEAAAGHLLQPHISEPHWDPRQERVVAYRRATLYGLTIYRARMCDYSQVNPEACRMIFIRSALVDGGLDTRLPFYVHNRALVSEIESLEHRTRRRDILADEAEIQVFYEERLPAFVNSASSLRKWYRSLGDQEKPTLRIPRERLLLHDPQEALRLYPDEVEVDGIPLKLSYLYDPTSERDGVTVRIPLPLLNQIRESSLERSVPGLLSVKLTALIRTLSKPVRRQLIPVPDTVAELQDIVVQDSDPLPVALSRAILAVRRIEVCPEDFALQDLPPHLQMGLELVDNQNRPLAFHRDLETLQSQFGQRAHASFVACAETDIIRHGIRRWDFDELPRTLSIRVGDYHTRGWPAVVDCEDSVSIEVFDHEEIARMAHRDGVRRLLWLSMPIHRKLLKQPLLDWQWIRLRYSAIGNTNRLPLAVLHKAQDRVFFEERPEVRHRQDFINLMIHQGPLLPAAVETIARQVARILASWSELREFVREHEAELPQATLKDVMEQLSHLVYDGFVEDTPVGWLPELKRYLQGIRVRLEQAWQDPPTDSTRARRVSPWWQLYLKDDGCHGPARERFRWLLEEFRVSIFAQRLGTSVRISAPRLEAAWQDVLTERATHRRDVRRSAGLSDRESSPIEHGLPRS